MPDEPKTVDIEVWVLVDENGDYVAIDDDVDALEQRYDDAIGGVSNLARRIIQITLKVPIPVPIKLWGTVPPEPSEGELKIAELA